MSEQARELQQLKSDSSNNAKVKLLNAELDKLERASDPSARALRLLTEIVGNNATHTDKLTAVNIAMHQETMKVLESL